MPTDRPPKIPGSAPGRTTDSRIRPRPPPIVRTASSQTGDNAATAWRVDTRTGKNAAVHVMNTIPCSFEGKRRIATGTSAIAGIGRSTSSTGPSTSAATRERAIAVPTATPSTAASAKPDTIRLRLETRSCQYGPVDARSASFAATSPTVGNCPNRSQSSTSSEVSSCHATRAAPSEARRSSRRPGVMRRCLRLRRSSRSAPRIPGAGRRTTWRPPG